jgi:hypothetical protein
VFRLKSLEKNRYAFTGPAVGTIFRQICHHGCQQARSELTLINSGYTEDIVDQNEKWAQGSSDI